MTTDSAAAANRPDSDQFNVHDLEHSHAPEDIARRLATPPGRGYLKDAIYGGVDGAVTTFAVVSGVAGAGLSPGIVIVLGAANLVGDGFSMAAGNFLGTRAENQQREQLRQIERKHIRQVPDGEREEVRQILQGQGFEGQLLEDAVSAITSDESRWVDTMLSNEYGVSLQRTPPILAAMTTFISFMLVGALPLLPFAAGMALGVEGAPFWSSALLTGIAFFGIGAVKAQFVQQSWWWAGIETLLVGSIAAVLAYLCGYALAGLVTL